MTRSSTCELQVGCATRCDEEWRWAIISISQDKDSIRYIKQTLFLELGSHRKEYQTIDGDDHSPQLRSSGIFGQSRIR